MIFDWNKKVWYVLFLIFHSVWDNVLYIYMVWFYFLSSKFSRKLNFVESLAELAEIVPLEQASIPDRVKQWVFYLISWFFSIKSNVICMQGNLFQIGKLLHSFGPVLAPWDQYQSDTFCLLLT